MATREHVDVFQTVEDAHAAIAVSGHSNTPGWSSQSNRPTDRAYQRYNDHASLGGEAPWPTGAGMFYAVRAEFSDGRIQWMTPANAQGVRGFDVLFDEAATFPHEERARSAIAAMPADAAVRLSIVEVRPD
jgi:hypothetical protein